MRPILESTHDFEVWLAKQTPLVAFDLRYKHAQMVSDPFLFLRATFYRWLEVFPQVLPDLAGSPRVPAVGDLHVENFGTWRDIEGRLAWGINDFDEAARFPYALDLVRLTVSASLAGSGLGLSMKEAARAILEGYLRTLDRGGEPIVLAERHGVLRRMALGTLAEPEAYWTRLDAKTAPVRRVPGKVRKALATLLPEGADPAYRAVTVPKGLGSLGRPRFVALADYKGARIAREAKAFVPSAVNWLAGGKVSGKKALLHIVAGAVRCPDPFWTISGKWIVRRLSPDCRRIELADLAKERDADLLLRAMGHETANVHLGDSAAADAAWKDARRRGLGGAWLAEAGEAMAAALRRDWKAWRKG